MSELIAVRAPQTAARLAVLAGEVAILATEHLNRAANLLSAGLMDQVAPPPFVVPKEDR